MSVSEHGLESALRGQLDDLIVGFEVYIAWKLTESVQKVGVVLHLDFSLLIRVSSDLDELELPEFGGFSVR